MNNIDNDVARYKKKSNKRTPKKANHKHEYEDVVFKYYRKEKSFSKSNGFIGGIDYCIGSRCKICGRLDYGNSLGYNFIHEANAHPENLGLPVVEVKDIWKLNT